MILIYESTLKQLKNKKNKKIKNEVNTRKCFDL